MLSLVLVHFLDWYWAVTLPWYIVGIGFHTAAAAFAWGEAHLPFYSVQWCHFNPVTGRFDYCV